MVTPQGRAKSIRTLRQYRRRRRGEVTVQGDYINSQRVMGANLRTSNSIWTGVKKKQLKARESSVNFA